MPFYILLFIKCEINNLLLVLTTSLKVSNKVEILSN